MPMDSRFESTCSNLVRKREAGGTGRGWGAQDKREVPRTEPATDASPVGKRTGTRRRGRGGRMARHSPPSRKSGGGVKAEEDVPAMGEVGMVDAAREDQLVAGPAERRSIERW